MSDDNTGGWRDSLPEALRDSPYIKNAESPEAAASEIAGAAQYMGNSIRIPSEDAGDEDRNAFYAKLQEKVPGLMRTPNGNDWDAAKETLRALGMPEKPEQYQTDGIDNPPSDEELGKLRALAHDAGLTTAQWKKFVGEMSKSDAEQMEKLEFEREKSVNELKGEWGGAWDSKLSAAMKAAELTGAPDFVMEMAKAGQLDAKTLRWLDSIADQITGDEGAQGGFQGKQTDQPLTPAEVDARLSEVERRLFDRATPADQKPMLIEKRMKYMRMLSA